MLLKNRPVLVDTVKELLTDVFFVKFDLADIKFKTLLYYFVDKVFTGMVTKRCPNKFFKKT